MQSLLDSHDYKLYYEFSANPVTNIAKSVYKVK